MLKRNRLAFYIFINVVVSALTALLVLLIWSRLNAPTPVEHLLADETLESEQAQPANVPSNDFEGQLSIRTIIGSGDVQNERVLIEHIGQQEISLAAWQLEDEGGNRYTFPALVLHPGGSVELLSRQGDDSVTELFWNQNQTVWSEGEMAKLIDPNGVEQDMYIVP